MESPGQSPVESVGPSYRIKIVLTVVSLLFLRLPVGELIMFEMARHVIQESWCKDQEMR